VTCHSLIQRLRHVHDKLSSLDSLVPSPQVDALFTDLVRMCSAYGEHRILDCPDVQAIAPSLRRLCAQGEYQLEREWAWRIIDARDPADELRRFPYEANYRRLVELEVHSLLGLGYGGIRAAAFVGAGPLPLSAILLAERHGWVVNSIEREAEAHGLAVKVVDRLGLDQALRFHHCDVLDFGGLRRFDVVFLAALVGRDRVEKRRLFAHLAAGMRPGAVLLARTADQLRTMLYPRIRLEDLSGFSPKLLLHPLHDVINSVIVAERTDGGAVTGDR